MKKVISTDSYGWVTTVEYFKKPHGYPTIYGLRIMQTNTHSGDSRSLLFDQKEAKKLTTFLNNCYKKQKATQVMKSKTSLRKSKR